LLLPPPLQTPGLLPEAFSPGLQVTGALWEFQGGAAAAAAAAAAVAGIDEHLQLPHAVRTLAYHLLQLVQLA
jgi:hypothetical protein